MAKTRITKTRMNEALEVLDQAAKERKEDLTQMMTDKYSELRSNLAGGSPVSKFASQGQETIKNVFGQGQSKIKVAATDIDRKAHKKPWPFVAGAAALGSAVATGMMARIRRNHEEE